MLLLVERDPYRTGVIILVVGVVVLMVLLVIAVIVIIHLSRQIHRCNVYSGEHFYFMDKDLMI